MGEIFNQLTGSMDSGPMSESPSGKLPLAFSASEGVDQQRAVRVFKAQMNTGLPRNIIDTHLDEIESASQQQGFDADKFRAESPLVASWLAEDPNNVALAREEVGYWGEFERAIQSAKESWRNELDAHERNQLLLKEFNGYALTPEEAARRDKLGGDILYRARQNQSETGAEYFARVNASGVYQMGQSMKEQIKGASVGGTVMGVAAAVTVPEVVLPAVITGMGTGAMMSGGAYSYNQEAPALFDDLRSMKDVNGATIDVNDARNVARVTGVLLATVETASGAAVASMIPGVKNIVGNAVGAGAAKRALVNQIKLAMSRPTTATAIKSAAAGFLAAPTTEALEEFTQAMISAGGREVAQSISGQYFAPNDISEDLASARQQAQDAFVGSIFAMGAPVGGTRLYTGMREARIAKQNEAYFSALGEAANNSKAYKILPQKMREVVDRVIADGPVQEVYVDATQWRTYFQNKGLDPKAVAQEVLGSTKEYDKAVEQDSQIRIPITDYAAKIAPTEHNSFFSKEIRQSPAAMNSREADEFYAQAEKTVKDGMSVEKTVKDEVAARLVKIGYEQQTADYIATQTGAFFETQAKNLGIVDPMQLFDRYGVDIKRGDTEGATYKQDVMPVSLLSTIRDVDRNTSEKYPGHLSEVQADIAERGIEEPVKVTISTSSGMAYISNGNTRVTAAMNLGLPTAPVTYEKTEVPLTAAQKRRARPVSELGIDVNSIPDKTLTPQEMADKAELQRILGTKYFQEARGSITIGPDRKMSINITDKADLSTFIHESGHLYLEVLRDLSTESGWQKLQQFLGKKLPDSEKRQQLKADAAIIAEWLGAKDLENVTVEQHEQFARGIEAYLMEGKAPSVELRPVFARFRAWLVALYKTVSNLGVRLNPEVRAVFDRMFATDEAIKAAQSEALITPVFATAEEAGMSDTEFAGYKKLLADASEKAQSELQQKVMRQMQREQEAEWKRRRDEIRDSVRSQLSERREYVVLDYLSNDDTKLSRDALYAMYPEKFRENTVMQAMYKLDTYRSKNGLDPEAVAQKYGYSSADEMVRSLISVKPLAVAVEDEVKVQMKARYGDILTDGTIADEAMARVLGPGRSEVLEAELRALRKRQREARPVVSAVLRGQQEARRTGMDSLTTGVPPLSVVRRVAQDTIAQMRVRSLNPQVYLVASRNASKAALTAVHKGDYHIAAYHKQKELLNVELYRESVRVREEADSIVKFMRKFEEPSTRERLGRAGDFYLEQIDAILERFDFSRLTTKEAAKRKVLSEWIKDRQEAGQQVVLPDEIINEAYRKPWKEMSFDELVGVSDAARHIKHLATLKNKLLKSKADRELSATVNLIDETIAINARHGDSRQRETRLPQDAAGQAVAGFFAAHRKIASLAREMDGFKDGGPVWESIIWPLNEAASAEAMMHEKSNAVLHELFKPYTTLKEQSKTLASAASFGNYQTGIYKKEFIPEINDSLSKVGRLMVAMNWGNESNRSRIMEGYNWTAQQVEAILAPLTKEDWDFVQGVWDHFESFWPEIEALSKRVDGVAPKKIQAAPVLTPFGEYRGGYFPAKYDERQSPRAFANLAKEAADRAMHGAAVRAVTAHGERINRVQNVKMPVRLDFGVINEALNETIHDITHYETLIDLNRVVGHPRVQGAMVAHFGHEVYQQFRSALRDVAGGDIPAQTHVDKSLNWIRKGTTIAGMGWNLMTGLMQPLGLTQSIVRIGPKYVAKGVSRWLGNAARMEKTVEWIYSKSAIMQERSITQSREINEIRNQVSPTGVLGPVQDSYFYLIVKIQQVVDVPTWLGAYEMGMEKFDGDEVKAIAVADQAVLDSQGGGQIKDRAAVQRGGPAQMLWTNFYSYFNTTFNLTAESYRKTNFKNGYEAGRFAADMLLLYTVPALLSMFIRDALRGDVEDDPDKLMKKMLQQQMSYLVGPVLLAREIGGTLQGYYGYEGPAGAQFFAQLAKLIKQIEQGKPDEAAAKAANKVMGILFHYPAGQLQRTVEGVAYDMEEGTPNPLPILVGPPKE